MWLPQVAWQSLQLESRLAWRDTAYHGLPWQEMAWLDTAWHGVACHGMTWHSMAWHGMARHDMAWPGKARHGTARQTCEACVARRDMTWRGIARHGMAWHGLAWQARQANISLRSTPEWNAGKDSLKPDPTGGEAERLSHILNRRPPITMI